VIDTTIRSSKPPSIDGEYPFELWSIIAGCVLALVAGLVFQTQLACVLFMVLAISVGFVWRKGEVPILSYCLLVQWLFMATGYLVWVRTGRFPGITPSRGLETAIFLSILGLAAMTAGIRAGRMVFAKTLRRWVSTLPTEGPRYDVRKVMWLAVGAYSLDWIFRVERAALHFPGGQVVVSLLQFKVVVLFLLFLVIVRQREGLRYGVFAAVVAWVPALASYMSSFSEVFQLVMLALLTAWQPWRTDAGSRRTNRLVTSSLGVVGVVLVGMALFWQGAVKRPWRTHLDEQGGDVRPLERVGQLFTLARDVAGDFDIGEAAYDLGGRVSSGSAYFGSVVTNVPSVIPHEDGELTKRALLHVTRPRFFFPEKENLGGDSWLVQTYAREDVADERSGTSVGLGYFAQFYIDFAVPGMFAAVFVIGLLIAFIYEGLAIPAPTFEWWQATATALLLASFTGYESEIAKMVGALVMTTAIFTVLLIAARYGDKYLRWSPKKRMRMVAFAESP